MLKVSAELKDLNLSDLLEGIVPFPAAAVASKGCEQKRPANGASRHHDSDLVFSTRLPRNGESTARSFHRFFAFQQFRYELHTLI